MNRVTPTRALFRKVSKGEILQGKLDFPEPLPEPKYLQELFSQMTSKDQSREWEQIRRTIDFFFKNQI